MDLRSTLRGHMTLACSAHGSFSALRIGGPGVSRLFRIFHSKDKACHVEDAIVTFLPFLRRFINDTETSRKYRKGGLQRSNGKQ